jgi:F0F1-type ATP synthase assembly protein I
VARRTSLQQAGLLTAIPFVLLTGPVLGYYLGSAVDRRWAYAPWGMGIGIVLGLIASARVTAQFIRQSRDLNKHP